jgi:hypothetical protein
MINKFCNTCEKTLPISEFYSNGYSLSGTKKYKPFCKKCESNRRKSNWLDRIKSVFPVLECSNCGYNKNFAALEFHHLDSSTKDIQISKTRTASKEVTINELKKCIILCANCHRELHKPNETLGL